MEIDARPVRSPLSSFRTCSIAWSMRVVTSAFSPLISVTSMTVPHTREVLVRAHDGSHRFAHDDSTEVPRVTQPKNDDRQLVVHAERNSGGVHDLQTALEDLEIRE